MSGLAQEPINNHVFPEVTFTYKGETYVNSSYINDDELVTRFGCASSPTNFKALSTLVNLKKLDFHFGERDHNFIKEQFKFEYTNEEQDILNKLDMKISDIGTETMIYKLGIIDLEGLRNELNIENYTFYDIIDALKKPHRDPRDEAPKPILKSDVLTIEDVKMGMELTGTVRNVVDFGIFIDVGLHNDALAHVSKLSKDYVRHPSNLFKVGDIVTCYVIGIDEKNEKVSVSLLKEDKI